MSLARQTGRPVQYLTSTASNKEAIAHRIAVADHVDQGLICVLTAVEPCWSDEIVRDHANKQIEAETRYRKCLQLYHYQIHPRFNGYYIYSGCRSVYASSHFNTEEGRRATEGHGRLDLCRQPGN